MCLNAVIKRLTTPKKSVFYKLFREQDTKIYPLTDRGPNSNQPLRKNVVHTSSEEALSPIIYGNSRYTLGFHGYKTLAAIEKALNLCWVRTWEDSDNKIVIAKCEGLVHTLGKQDNIVVTVASTMKILEVL